VKLRRKTEKISKNPDYFLKRSRRIKSDLNKLANVYSFWLENPDLRGRVLNVERVNDTRELRYQAKVGVENIMAAWNYLRRINTPGAFENHLTPEIIQDVGAIVLPDLNQVGFRTTRVSLNLDYVPPNPVKVPEMVEDFCYELQQSDYVPVESGIVTHLGLAAIQPFKDGNKRTARLFQDRIFKDHGLPPAVIPAGERDVYIDLLEEGMKGYREGNLKMQRPFFDYIGGKVNTALDEILNDLVVDGHSNSRTRPLGH
jgi:hypothetical protein